MREQETTDAVLGLRDAPAESAPPGTEEALDRFRERASGRGMPADDVERWLRQARRCAVLGTRVDGPVVGRLGGPLMLPPEAPDLDWWDHLIATIDCATLPSDATDLPLPPDGHLLLLAYPGGDDYVGIGKVIYVPAGTPVEERVVDHDYSPDDHLADLDAKLVQEGELHLGYDVSLPDHDDLVDEVDHPRARELREIGLDRDAQSWAELQIGGYATDEYGEQDPVTASGRRAARAWAEGSPPSATEGLPRPEDWVLLAQWSAGISGLEGMRVFWAIDRQDLAARRFDRAEASLFWNP